MIPVVMKIPPPMVLLTSTQEALNQPIFCVTDFRLVSLMDESVPKDQDGRPVRSGGTVDEME